MALGFQTEEFMSRLESYQAVLPVRISRMAQVMKDMIREIDAPLADDIQRLREAIREVIGSEEDLIELCGSEGRWCSRCPFGAYLPQGVPFASEAAPFCLPWTAVRQGSRPPSPEG